MERESGGEEKWAHTQISTVLCYTDRHFVFDRHFVDFSMELRRQRDRYFNRELHIQTDKYVYRERAKRDRDAVQNGNDQNARALFRCKTLARARKKESKKREKGNGEWIWKATCSIFANNAILLQCED